MAYKPRQKSTAKHRQILDAAVRLFLDRGYSGTSMDGVAEEAGVSKHTVYSHFSSKEELFEAVVSSKCPGADLPPEVLDPEAACRETLVRLGRYAADILLSEESIKVYRLCVGVAEEYPSLSRLFFRTGPERLIAALAAYLREQTGRSRLNVDSPRLAASQLVLSFRGEAGLRLELNVPLDAGTPSRAKHIERCVDVFLSYYAAPATRAAR